MPGAYALSMLEELPPQFRRYEVVLNVLLPPALRSEREAAGAMQLLDGCKVRLLTGACPNC